MDTLKFKETYSWQGAVDLGTSLVVLAEALPTHEQTGLVMQLHQLMLDLPSQIAADLSENSRSRFGSIYRLASALDLIENIYPALDTADVRSDFIKLVTRLDSDTFSEKIPSAKPEIDSEVSQSVKHIEDNTMAEEVLPMASTEAPLNPPQPIAAPSSVPILPNVPVASSAPDITELPVGVAVTSSPESRLDVMSNNAPAQSVDVQPNSFQ
jgi:hypothetical protein